MRIWIAPPIAAIAEVIEGVRTVGYDGRIERAFVITVEGSVRPEPT